jgi:hypothetical protein
MSVCIKSRNFTPNKTELTFEQGGGLGWAPGYEKQFRGIETKTTPLYGKNYSRAFGQCKVCSKFTGKTGTNGEHCGLPENMECEK